MSRRNLLRATGLVGSAVVLQSTLSACGGRSGDAAAKGEILFLSNESETETVRIRQKQFAAFEAKHGGASVKPEFLGADATDQRVVQLMGAGTPPDIVQSDDTDFAELAAQGALEPVTDVIAQLGDIPDSARLVIDGEDYFVPADLGVWMLFYRRDLLESAGVGAPKTWQEMQAAMEALDGGQAAPNLLVTNTASSYVSDATMNYVRSAGAAAFTWNGSGWDVSLDDSDNLDKVVEALEFLKVREQYSAPGGSYDWPDVNQAFASNKIAMVEYSGARTLTFLEAEAPDVAKVTGVSTIPKLDILAPRTTVGGYALFRKEGRDPQAAKELLLSMVTGKLYLDYLWTVPGHLIPPQQSIREGEWAEHPFIKRHQDLTDVIAESLPLAVNPMRGLPTDEAVTPNLAAGAAFNAGVYAELMGEVIVEGGNAEEAIKRAADKLRTLQSDLGVA